MKNNIKGNKPKNNPTKLYFLFSFIKKFNYDHHIFCLICPINPLTGGAEHGAGQEVQHGDK